MREKSSSFVKLGERKGKLFKSKKKVLSAPLNSTMIFLCSYKASQVREK